MRLHRKAAEATLEALRMLVKGKEAGYNPREGGVCGTLDDRFEEVMCIFGSNLTKWDSEEVQKWLRRVCKKWGRYSGDEMYPIPCPNAYKRPSTEFIDTCLSMGRLSFWTGMYGGLRWSYVRFLIVELESYKEDREILDNLIDLRAKAKAGKCYGVTGICNYMRYRVDVDAWLKLHDLMMKWEYSTGCGDFIVPSKLSDTSRGMAQLAYLRSRTTAGPDANINEYWVGEYGEARMALLDYMIEELK